MPFYVTYRDWTNVLDIVNADKSEKNVVEISDELYDEMLQTPYTNYIVNNGKVQLKDHIVRNVQEDIITEIPYGKHGTIKIDVFPDDNLLHIKVNARMLQDYIDPFQIDKIEFLNPKLEIDIHNKETQDLLGTLELDLDEYFKRSPGVGTIGIYKQDISLILKKVDALDLVFKTKKCFEFYAYEIIEPLSINPISIDRNLIGETSHLIVCIEKEQILIKNNIKYWQEFNNILSNNLTIGFIQNNPNELEHYVSFSLQELKEKNNLYFKKPKHVNIENKKIHCNNKQLKIKYENTSN